MNRQPHHLPSKKGTSSKRAARDHFVEGDREAAKMREHLVLCYRVLSEAYEAVQGLSVSADEEVGGAVAVIIEEDLRSLLEECEGFLIDSSIPNPSGLSSFEARSLTIIEEVNSIISLLLPKHGRDAWH